VGSGKLTLVVPVTRTSRLWFPLIHIGSNKPQSDSNNKEVVLPDALGVKVLILLSLEETLLESISSNDSSCIGRG
jgi:hypothetical protein